MEAGKDDGIVSSMNEDEFCKKQCFNVTASG